MNKSFKLHVMLQILILFVIYLFANRLYAQYLAYEFIQDKVNLELLNLVESQDTFSIKSTESKTKFFSNTKLNSLVKCSTTHHLTSDLCEEFKNQSIDWTQTETAKSELIKFGKHSFNGVTWKIVHKKNNLVDDYLAVDESEINLILEQTWEIRDYVQSRIYLFMITLLVIFSYYLSNHIVKIINKAKKYISNTDIKNLSEIPSSPAIYTEFQPFIQVFNDLRIRLKTSFEQASRFSSDASHELKTPLTILRGYAERGVKTSKDGSNEQIQFILMAEEIGRLINITDKLLILARSDAGRLEITPSLVNLTDVFEQLASDAETINPDLRISTNIQKKINWKCDPQLIHQLIYNLYSNAFKYNTVNGWIHFELTLVNHELTMAVINSSVNVPKDLSDKAFDRFYRGDESHTRKIEGTGLGLSLCKEIAKIHGGELSLEVNAQQEVSAKFTVKVKD